MNKGLLFFAVLASSLFWFTISNAQVDTCLRNQAVSIQLSGDDFSDLQQLKELVKDKKIVLLGESSHGIGEFYALKSRLVQFLYQECGFEVLAMESGIGDLHFTLNKIDSLTPLMLRNGTVYTNFQCREIMPLFELIKSSKSKEKPLHFIGIDSQNFGTSMFLVQEITRKITPRNADSLMQNFAKYMRIPSLLWQEDKKPLIALADSISKSCDYIHNLLKNNKQNILTSFKISELDYQFLWRVINNLKAGVSLDWNHEDPSAKRDSIMADNLFWQLQQFYPNKKVILWAHNGHIDKTSPAGNPYKWLGHYIKERMMDASYHLGLFAQQGETYEWWTRSTKILDKPGNSDIETLYSHYPITFTNLRRGFQSCPQSHQISSAFELENGGRLNFVPIQRFDGIIVVKTAHIPTYN
ncbi:MAG: erythromycin esterase family protein [Bacteroidia bacterium]|nr:erythromycin esterase family protein [Bacteroidia bacterium]